MNNENDQFSFETDIKLEDDLNGESELTPNEIRMKILPFLVIVLILFIVAIIFAFSYFGKDNRDKLICTTKQGNTDVKYVIYFEDDKAEEIEMIMKFKFSSIDEKEKYLNSIKNNGGYCKTYKTQLRASYCKEENDDETVTLTIGIEATNYIEEGLEATSIKEMKEEMQKKGFTCEEKIGK